MRMETKRGNNITLMRKEAERAGDHHLSTSLSLSPPLLGFGRICEQEEKGPLLYLAQAQAHHIEDGRQSTVLHAPAEIKEMANIVFLKERDYIDVENYSQRLFIKRRKCNSSFFWPARDSLHLRKRKNLKSMTISFVHQSLLV